MASSSAPSKIFWHTDNYVGQIDMRVDLVRMDFYRLLILGMDEDDFYIEEAFNCFLGAAQVPLNFAIYKNNDLLFHFVSDIKYKKEFTKILNKEEYKSKSLIPFFPQLFGDEYRISVFRMNTKEYNSDNWIKAIIPNEELENKENLLVPIESHEQYLERCVWRFFIDSWDGFYTGIKLKTTEAIASSIRAAAEQFQKISPESESAYINNCLYSYEDESTAAYHHKKWHEKLRKIFERPLSDAIYGLEAQALMMIGADRSKNELPIPNMIFSYRSFTRTSIRSGWNENNDGYSYDTQLLIRDENGGDNLPVVDFFKKLEKIGKLEHGVKKFEQGEDRDFNSRLLYKDVFSRISKTFIEERYKYNKFALRDLNEMADILDNKFWSFIKEHGSAECIKILQSPVGDNSRSFVDPVYHTGLIHFNAIFELGGLDRVGKKIDYDWNHEIREKFIDENFKDLMRIVMLYYLFSEMSDWGEKTKNFNPALLEAVLVPLKMRGSVWAVTLHAAYRKNYNLDIKSEIHRDVPRWMSIYHICTTLRKKNRDIFDKTLWENSQRRVIRLLEKSFETFPDTKKFKDIIFDFNEKTAWEQRYVPYALPEFIFDDTKLKNGTIIILGESGAEYKLNWAIRDNPYFTGHQPWSRLGTRSFQTAIEFGFNRGLAKIANYIEIEDAEND